MDRSFLGVLGGMGPAATSDFLAKLVHETDAKRDQDHVPVLVWGDCRIPDRTAALLRGAASPQAGLMAGAEGLVLMGAKAIVIPCNTAHAWAQALVSNGAPLIHIADAVADEAWKWQARRIGLMATSGTVAAHVYEARLDERGIQIIRPSDEEQCAVDMAITAVKAGRVQDATAPLQQVHQKLLDRGADLVVLACTEIPLALDGLELDKTVDATTALARAALRWWRLQESHSKALQTQK